MDLKLNLDLVSGYKSNSQKARILTQSWIEENMYCPICSSDRLQPTTEGTPTIDFICPDCIEPFQLKSQNHSFGKKIVDAAYQPMVQSIKRGSVPNFFFLHYDATSWEVKNLLSIPRYFFNHSIIEKRKPLSQSARRAGWIGCNILLGNLPDDGKIPIISSSHPLNCQDVRKQWKRFAFLYEIKPEYRGWTVDVISCIRKIPTNTFNLADVYSFEKYLAKLHPNNKNVRP
jgi:type II restriction enzyme